MIKRMFADLRCFGVAGVLMSLGALFWGPMAALGTFLGVIGTAFNIFALWLMIRLLAMSAMHSASMSTEDEQEAKRGAVITVGVFFIKLPMMVSLMWLVQRIGGFADEGFLWGLGLVYCWLVGWAESTKE